MPLALLDGMLGLGAQRTERRSAARAGEGRDEPVQTLSAPPRALLRPLALP